MARLLFLPRGGAWCVLWLVAGLSLTTTALAATFPHTSSLSDVIELEVVTSTSGPVLHEAPSSSHVLLRVSFTDGLAHGDVSLFDCMATTQDGGFEVKLTDFRGCQALKSPMGCMVQENDLLVSPEFELSSLAEDGDVIITCSWEVCSEPHHPKCQNRCNFFTTQPLGLGARRRRQGQSRDEQSRDGDSGMRSGHSISTHIRVLPSHVGHRHHHGGHHSEHMQSSAMRPRPAAVRTPTPNAFRQHHEGMVATYPSPLMYLNPIVCSLFLLILSVFLGIYVSFVRSLSRTVHHIKTEIERQRSRDKFLLPPCHE